MRRSSLSKYIMLRVSTLYLTLPDTNVNLLSSRLPSTAIVITFLKFAGVTRVNVLALVDYLKYKKQLDAGRRVPPFDINKVAKEAVINWDELDP